MIKAIHLNEVMNWPQFTFSLPCSHYALCPLNSTHSALLFFKRMGSLPSPCPFTCYSLYLYMPFLICLINSSLKGPTRMPHLLVLTSLGRIHCSLLCIKGQVSKLPILLNQLTSYTNCITVISFLLDWDKYVSEGGNLENVFKYWQQHQNRWLASLYR